MRAEYHRQIARLINDLEACGQTRDDIAAELILYASMLGKRASPDQRIALSRFMLVNAADLDQWQRHDQQAEHRGPLH